MTQLDIYKKYLKANYVLTCRTLLCDYDDVYMELSSDYTGGVLSAPNLFALEKIKNNSTSEKIKFRFIIVLYFMCNALINIKPAHLFFTIKVLKSFALKFVNTCVYINNVFIKSVGYVILPVCINISLIYFIYTQVLTLLLYNHGFIFYHGFVLLTTGGINLFLYLIVVFFIIDVFYNNINTRWF